MASHHLQWRPQEDKKGARHLHFSSREHSSAFVLVYHHAITAVVPSYSNFSRWYVLWLLVAGVYHLPSMQSMGVDIKMNVSLFLTLFLYSVLALLVFHITFLVLWYMGLVARFAGKRPEILTILQNSVVLSIACCVFYSYCGNRAPTRTKSFGSKDFGLVVGTFIKGWPQVHELKEQVCSNWLASVGSASDYPVFSKWVIYGQSADKISPIFSLWATFIGLYIANYVVERSTGWALTHPQSASVSDIRKASAAPDFLDMVPWYSGTSADLFKTAFDLLVSLTLFLGRFDMRMMQAAMTKAQSNEITEGFLFNHLKAREELWFDFMADTGDGGNSTYSVARLLAQPSLKVSHNDNVKELPRGDLLLIGGDLAYPNPSPFTYERRLFCPFEFALQPPACYKPENIAVYKPELPAGVDSLRQYRGPQAFAIPGNHDWFDGLETFMRYICHKSWLGGWILPQQRSYFALQLPHGWWIFGFDQALHGDIDIYQFKFFTELVKNQVKESDRVIIITHEPNWLLDWYWSVCTGNNVSHLIKDHLKGKCRVRLAGDLHHYMRHSALPSSKSVYVEHLIVNGCGGAFLHPTHVFSNFHQFLGATYEHKAAYPCYEDSKRIALGNILKFRKKNWQFDVIGGIIYFLLVFSTFPQCNLDHILQDDTWLGHLQQCFETLWNAFMDILKYSYVSLAGIIMLLLLSFMFVPVKLSRRRRAVIGFLHVSTHITAAMILMLLLELGIETCVRHKLLGTSGYHTLYDWYRTVESEHFPDPTGLRTRMENWTFGLYPACIKYLMSAFDVPEVIAVTRNNICKSGMEKISREFAVIYYICIFIYFWVFSTPVVSLVFGSYLYICVNWLHIHFDEAYSSLRMANYKSFTRFHLNPKGNLDVYTLAVNKVPREWKLDSDWDAEQREQLPSHLRQHPSKWAPKSTYSDPNCTVQIIDHFVIEK
ncbi:hypothetical protein SUGI_0994890 [Cryptomeria japonica]|nr:hypothetical protein SUGI_0994890 [Cryptomeria japonica]